MLLQSKLLQTRECDFDTNRTVCKGTLRLKIIKINVAVNVTDKSVWIFMNNKYHIFKYERVSRYLTQQKEMLKK